jgi:4-hydroxybenzoate polyprenyltransferase
LINTFIFSNIFLSVGAVLLTVSAQVQLGMRPHWRPYLLLIFFATLFEYNRNWLIELFFYKEDQNTKKRKWILKNRKKLLFVTIISATLLLFAVFTTKPQVLFVFIFLGILTFLYSMPVSGNKSYLFKLRDVPYLKIFLIAFVWSALTVFLPAIQAGEEILNVQVELLFAERFFFIFAITIPFDIRDMQVDRDAGLKTIPLLVNQKKALTLSYLSLLISLIISVFHYKMQNNLFIIEALCISFITTYLFLKLKTFRNLNKYYYQILDGTLLLQALLILGFYFFH